MKNLLKTLIFFIGGYPMMFPGFSVGSHCGPKVIEIENEEENETEPESS